MVLLLVPAYLNPQDSGEIPESASDLLTVAWESGLKPPFLIRGEDGEPDGIAVRLADEIFKRASLRVNHRFYPWSRCLVQLRYLKVDIVPNSSYKPERKEFAYYSDSIYLTHMRLYYKRNRFPTPPEIQTLAQLQRYKIGGVQDFNYYWLQETVVIDQGATDREGLLQKLQAEKFDFAAMQQEVVENFKFKDPDILNGIESIPDPVLPEKHFFFLIRKDAAGKELLTKINAALQEIRIDGTYLKIIQQYKTEKQ